MSWSFTDTLPSTVPGIQHCLIKSWRFTAKQTSVAAEGAEFTFTEKDNSVIRSLKFQDVHQGYIWTSLTTTCSIIRVWFHWPEAVLFGMPVEIITVLHRRVFWIVYLWQGHLEYKYLPERRYMQSKNDKKYIQDDTVMNMILQCDIVAKKWKWLGRDPSTGWKGRPMGLTLNAQDHMEVPEWCQKFWKLQQIWIRFATDINLYLSASLYLSLSPLSVSVSFSLSLPVSDCRNVFEPLKPHKHRTRKWNLANPNWLCKSCCFSSPQSCQAVQKYIVFNIRTTPGTWYPLSKWICIKLVVVLVPLCWSPLSQRLCNQHRGGKIDTENR